MLGKVAIISTHPLGDEFAIGAALMTAHKLNDPFTVHLPREITAEEQKYLIAYKGWTEDEIIDKRKNILINDI